MPTFAKPVSYGPSSAADPNEGRRFGGAFWLSATIHGLILGLLLFLTLVVGERVVPQTKIFELVAGEGDDFMATEAPAGSEAGQAESGEINFTTPTEVPTWTPPAPDPEPAAPAPPPTPVSRVEPTPAEPVKPVVKPEPVTPPVPNFTRQINRKLANEKKKADREIQKQREADTRAAKERELASKRMSYDEFAKSTGKSSSRSTAGGGTGAPGPRVDASGIKKGVTGGTGAGSKGAGGTALSASAEGSAMERYFSMLRSRLRENHEKPGGLSDLLNAEVQFTIAANGSISGVRIVRSSGNSDFDQSVIEAFSRVSMPARPDGKTDTIKLVFRMKELDGR